MAQQDKIERVTLQSWLDSLPPYTEADALEDARERARILGRDPEKAVADRPKCEACGAEQAFMLPNGRRLCRDHAAEDHGYEEAEAEALAAAFTGVLEAVIDKAGKYLPLRVMADASRRAAANIEAQADIWENS